MDVKKLIPLFLVAALLALCAANALASGNVRFITSAYVYGEAGWNRTGTIIRKGSVAQYMGAAGSWTRIRFGKHAGWVRSSCLVDSEDPVKVVYSAAEATADAVRTARVLRGLSASAIDTVQVTSTIAPDASALETVRPGETVTCLGNYIVNDTSDVFVEIRYGDTTGWVPAAALSGLPEFG